MKTALVFMAVLIQFYATESANCMPDVEIADSISPHNAVNMQFITAASHQDLPQMISALNDGADINSICDFKKRTALHLAVLDLNQDIVSELLRRHAQTELTDIYMDTPVLCLAEALKIRYANNDLNEDAVNKAISILNFLFETGASLNKCGCPTHSQQPETLMDRLFFDLEDIDRSHMQYYVRVMYRLNELTGGSN